MIRSGVREDCDAAGRRPRKRAILLATFCLGLTTALMAPAISQAALFHSFDSYFGGGSLSSPQALAVDQTTGDLYVLEYGNGCVSRYYGERGGPEALEPHDFPATGDNQICGFEFRGESSNAQIAIDNSGTSTEGSFYVNSPATNGGYGGTREYDVDGNFEAELTPRSADGGLVYVCGVTTDAAGNVYVDEHYVGPQKYNHDDPVTDADYETGLGGEGPACAFALTSTGARYSSWNSDGPLIHSGSVLRDTSLAITLDPSSDDIYVSEGGVVTAISDDGIRFDQFGAGQITEARGVAIDAVSGTAYVSDTPNGRIAVFDGEPACPARSRNHGDGARRGLRGAAAARRLRRQRPVRRLLPAVNRRSQGDAAASFESRRMDGL